jgi:hypothetical protein
MGLWSKIKKAVKKVVRVVRAVVRAVVRIVVTIVARLINVYDLLFGFLTWPPKKLRIHIAVLRDENGDQLVDPSALGPAIKYITQVFKDRLNVKVVPYGKAMVQVLDGPAPSAALDVHCDGGALGDEFGEAGEYFAQHLAGWNVIPISLAFPLTVYVVRDVSGKQGCSLGPLTDYVTVDLDGVRTDSLMAHEAGHALGQIGHLGDTANLMHKGSARGDRLRWWQKNLFRNSRHVTYF